MTCEAAFVNADTVDTPVSREDRTYEPVTLIGPDRFFTSIRPVLLTTCETVKRSRDHCLMWREFRQRKSWLLPTVSGM